MRRAFSVGLIAGLVFAVSIPALAAGSSDPLLNPVNGHFYETVTVSGGINWFDARAAAELRSFGVVQGHLATITSAQEDDFIATNFPEAFPIIPVPRPVGCEVPTTVENSCGYPYWLGGFQPTGSPPGEPGGGWEWVTGEPFVYTNWADGEPNDFDGRDEDCLEAHPDVFSPDWNDSQCDDRRIGGYVVEYDVSGRFIDDDNSIFEADIEWMAEQGITKGCNPPVNNMFCPDDFVSRGQMAAFLVRALGYIDDGGGDLFVDDDGHTFENDIDKLGTAGVTKGCNPPDNDRFCPDDRVSRGAMAAFLVRALGYTDNGGGNLFIDDDGSTFENDIDRLATAGVTKGCNPPVNDKFCPDDFVTRGQMAAFLHRALG